MRTNVIPEHLIKAEAEKCLGCFEPPCQAACPAGINIPGFINRILTGDHRNAARLIWEKNLLPSICGLVCPQEDLCRGACVAAQLNRTIDIGFLQYYAIVNGLQSADIVSFVPELENNPAVAVIGAGPSGITCAYLLALAGCKVTIYEHEEAAGGTMSSYIPDHRLPKEVVEDDLKRLEHPNIKIEYNQTFGNEISLKELMNKNYKALFLATGRTIEQKVTMPGCDFKGVYYYKEAFKQARINSRIFQGKNVAVIGGGNVAMDTAVTLLASGAESAVILYRRAEKDMPAWQEEIEYARSQGVDFKFQVRPLSFVGNEKGELAGIKMVMTVRDGCSPDGRTTYCDCEGTDFYLPVDQVVMAIGSTADQHLAEQLPNVLFSRNGLVEVDQHTMMTSHKGIFAGGDAVTTRGGTVVKAMAEGIAAARGIIEYLQEGGGLSV